MDSPLAGEPELDELSGVLEQHLAAGFPPAIALAVVGTGGPLLEAWGGEACAVGEPVPAARETRYDLASLTKVVCTVTLALLARERGLLALEDPVQAFVGAYPDPRTTLWHLLTHTSGLVDHRPFFETLSGRGEIEPAVCAEAIETAPGAPVRYSDLNYMLLGWSLEACFGQSLDELFAAEVAEPLAMVGTGFCPSGAERRRTAATELDGDQRRAPGLVWGEVHDGNAFALGGVAGHAGLFSTVDDLARFVQELLGQRHGVLGAGSVGLAATRQAGGEHGSGALSADGRRDVRGLGWRLEPEGWGPWPSPTIWHTGFTGTSILACLPAGVGVVLLTNAVHPRRRPAEQAALRAEIHGLIARALL